MGEEKGYSWQHRDCEARFLRKVEEMAFDKGYRKIAVMSGLGVRCVNINSSNPTLIFYFSQSDLKEKSAYMQYLQQTL